MCWAGLDQPHERADHTVEQSAKLGFEWSDPAERFRRFETSQSLARRSSSRLIARVTVLASTVSAFCEIERNADESPLQLIAKRRAARAQSKIGRASCRERV